jgi:hypothetical protein
LDQLTLFAAGSHAKTSAPPAREQASTANAADYGKSTPELLANFDHASSSWRTSQRSLFGGFSEFSETLPRSGMMQSGIAYQLPPLAPLTSGTGSGSWPTPTKSDYKGGHIRGRDSELKHHLKRKYGGTYPHPTFVEALMGFPIGHTDLAHSVMPLCLRSQKSSAEPS